MRAQDFIAEETLRAMEGLIHQAKRVPADKIEWKPLESGRTVLDQMQECAVIAAFYPIVLKTFAMVEMNDTMMATYRSERSGLDSIEKCEAKLRENTARAIEAILAVSDEDMQKEMTFFGPEPWKVSSVMNAHAWNMHWHTGQICYIQTLLGDKAMG